MTPFLLEGQHRQDLNRRGFLQTTSLASLGLVLSGRNPLPVDAAATQPSGGAAGIKTGRQGDLPSGGHPIKLFCCDLNWCGSTILFGERPQPRHKTGPL